MLNVGIDSQIFPHSNKFEQGIGKIRKGQNTFVVAVDGSGDFANPQDAIRATSSSGATIYLKDGIYSRITVNKPNISFEGSGFGCIVRGFDINYNANNTVIRYCNIDGTGLGESAGITLIDDSAVIAKYCNIFSNWIHDWGIGAIMTDTGDSDASLIISHNYIYSNSASDSSYAAIYLISLNYATIIGNIIFSNSYDGIGGENGSEHWIISNNQIYSNGAWGVDFNNVDNSLVVNNIIYNNTSGTVSQDGFCAGNTVINNILV